MRAPRTLSLILCLAVFCSMWAGVVSESGDVTKYYASVADAITVAKDGETVVVLVDATFSSDISVSANIALTSDGHTLTRTGDCSITNQMHPRTLLPPSRRLSTQDTWLSSTCS